LISPSAEFWIYLERLASDHPIIIDRPRGSAHPNFPELIYPLDYGYLEGTAAIDGNGVDLWLGSLPGRGLDALAITVDLLKGDAEIKLLLGCDEEEKQTILNFLNGQSMRASLVRRDQGLHLLRSRRSVRRFLPDPVPPETLQRILETAAFAPSAHNCQPWRFAVLSTSASRQRLAQALSDQFRHALIADQIAGLLNRNNGPAAPAGQDSLRPIPAHPDAIHPGSLPPEALASVEDQVERSRQRLLQAPAAVLLCQDTSTGDVYPDYARQQAEHLMGVQSVALAGGYLLLAAHAESLAGVWLCAPLFAPQVARLALDLPADWQPQAVLLFGYPAKSPPPRSRRPLGETVKFY
jgi:coenzyme F420-0:L-glutamate ligase / coenzyme F420-1:gamma-L-glutamate ligase